MELSFNPETQYLVFKPIYLETTDVISIYKGQVSPTYVIDPTTCTQEEMQQYWSYGLTHLFDIVDNLV